MLVCVAGAYCMEKPVVYSFYVLHSTCGIVRLSFELIV